MRSLSDRRPLPPESPSAAGSKRTARGIALVERVVSVADRLLPGHERRSEPHLAVENPLRDASGTVDFLLGRVSANPGEIVADIGAGLGYLTARLSRAVGPAGRVIATEIDLILVCRLRQHCTRNGLANVTVKLAKPTRVGFRTIVDKVLMVNVSAFKAGDAARRYLQELSRIVRPGGRVFVFQDNLGPDEAGGLESLVLAACSEDAFVLEERVPLREGALPARGTEAVRGYFVILRRSASIARRPVGATSADRA